MGSSRPHRRTPWIRSDREIVYEDLHCLSGQDDAAANGRSFHTLTESSGSGFFPGTRTGEQETGTWQTWRGRKGDAARVLFYLDVHYEGGAHGVADHAEPDLILTDNAALIQADSNSNKMTAYMGDLSVLLLWHAEDPADELERIRGHKQGPTPADGERAC